MNIMKVVGKLRPGQILITEFMLGTWSVIALRRADHPSEESYRLS
jgi:hypothetical protein